MILTSSTVYIGVKLFRSHYVLHPSRIKSTIQVLVLLFDWKNLASFQLNSKIMIILP